ncbi:hypothetical protein [Proteus phage RP7]|nr:hypothetical protein [Proteus phage RP7]
MKQLALLGLDIETLSRPKEAALDGKVVNMTSFAFVLMTPQGEMATLYVRLPANLQTLRGYHVDFNTLEWWLDSEMISEPVRDAQRAGWTLEEPVGMLMYNGTMGDVVTLNTETYTLEYLINTFIKQVSEARKEYGKIHAVGNGPDFDMVIYEAFMASEFPKLDCMPYHFSEVGSSRTLKALARANMEECEYFALEKEAEAGANSAASFIMREMATKVSSDFMAKLAFVPNWHDALFDSLNETIFNHLIIEKL